MSTINVTFSLFEITNSSMAMKCDRCISYNVHEKYRGCRKTWYNAEKCRDIEISRHYDCHGQTVATAVASGKLWKRKEKDKTQAYSWEYQTRSARKG